MCGPSLIDETDSDSYIQRSQSTERSDNEIKYWQRDQQLIYKAHPYM